MAEFEAWYIEEVDAENLFGSGICACGKPGYHIECQQRLSKILNESDSFDRSCIEKYSLTGEYGVVDSSRDSFNYACKYLSSTLKLTLDYDEADVVEGDTWWFIPHGWIGVLGFIVEKDTGEIYVVGSATSEDYRGAAFWYGIDQYISGNGVRYQPNI